MRLCKYTFLSFCCISLLLSLFCFSGETTISTRFSSHIQNKKKIAIFPFRNNTDIPGLHASIPDLLHGGLYRSGFFEIVESKKLYKTIWDVDISGSMKIDNTNIKEKGISPSQTVDLYSDLNKRTIEKVTKAVGADYSIQGSVNKFGKLIRIELDLWKLNPKEIIESLSAEVNVVEDIPNAVTGFIPAIEAVCIFENLDEICNDIVAKYRGGFSTFEKTVADIEGIAVFGVSSIYESSLLLSLYVEKGLNSKSIETCKTIISLIPDNMENAMDAFSRTGIDPFGTLAGLYESKGMFKAAAKVYNDALRMVPRNAADYYKRLGVVLIKEDQIGKAIDALQQSINLNSMDFDSHYQLALAYERDNNVSKALYEYKQSLKNTGGIVKGLPIDEIKRKIKELE